MLLHRIETHLRRTGMTATTFGRRAARDPRLVHDLRCGRCVGDRLAARVMAFIEEARA